MKHRSLAALALLLVAGTLFAQSAERMTLVAKDREHRLLRGVRFAYEGVESPVTLETGATELELPPGHWPGRKIEIFLISGPKPNEDWFLVDPMVNIPDPGGSADVVLMRRSEFRDLAAEARDAARPDIDDPERMAELRRQAILDTAARFGLTPDQFESAARSFGRTQNLKDKGISAYLEGQLATAEELLEKAAPTQEEELVETYRYLGAAQFEQGKIREALTTFRKAVALRADDPAILNWLARSLYEAAAWAEAEPLMRRALAIDEASYGPDHPKVATDLNNLALLLHDSNRLADAESLVRRAITIDEAAYGPEHPRVATGLSNLALFLTDTNRLVEAEPLVRRAIAIDEIAYGPEHPSVARDLTNLVLILKDTDRLDEAESLMRRALAIDEAYYGPDHPNVATGLTDLALLLKEINLLAAAECLMRRALAIDEASYGPDHPRVATNLNNLALLLQETNRLDEAEPLMRRALGIDEASLGPGHPRVATHLSNLALLLQDTNRLDEAEPLLRHALAIDEDSYGPGHPRVATDLNNLALLLTKTNRLNDAEPLMRRNLLILLQPTCRNCRDYPDLLVAIANYWSLLAEMGKSEEEIVSALDGISRTAEEASNMPPPGGHNR